MIEPKKGQTKVVLFHIIAITVTTSNFHRIRVSEFEAVGENKDQFCLYLTSASLKINIKLSLKFRDDQKYF